MLRYMMLTYVLLNYVENMHVLFPTLSYVRHHYVIAFDVAMTNVGEFSSHKLVNYQQIIYNCVQ